MKSQLTHSIKFRLIQCHDTDFQASLSKDPVAIFQWQLAAHFLAYSVLWTWFFHIFMSEHEEKQVPKYGFLIKNKIPTTPEEESHGGPKPLTWIFMISVFDSSIIYLTLKAPSKNCSRRHFNFLLLSFKENKAWFFMWIPCLVEDSLETSSLIFSEKQWKNIYEWRLLQSWLAL